MDEGQRYRLIVKSHHGTPTDLDEMKTLTKNDPRIHYLSDILSDEEHSALQKRADCYVSLHRSEGYGMNILEELGNGIPVIATNYSGNVDFFPPLNRYWGSCIFPLPYSMVILTESSGPYKAGSRWADPDHESAVKAMQEVVKNNCKSENGEAISRLTFSAFGMEAVAGKMKDLLKASRKNIRVKEKKMLLAFDQDLNEVTSLF
jgi:glycosyltransferase involved in cell wall biosynthesis